MQNIVITGAARGIGLELVRQYAAAGERVFAMARNPEGAKELADLAERSGGRISVHQMDVTDDASVADAVEGLSVDHVDILQNVAGLKGPIEPLLETDDWDWSDFDDLFEVSVKGPFRVLKAFLPLLGEGSKVINHTSQLGASTWPYGGYYPYVAAKAGLNRLMRSVSIDLKDRGIIIGILHPGYVRTDMGGPNADISVEESASGILEVTENWTLDQSGEFFRWDGKPHPW